MTQKGILTFQTEGVIVAYTANDVLKGVLLAGSNASALAAALVADGGQIAAQGALALRLGVALYDRPFVFVPHSIIDERGALFQGEIVFDWLRATAYDMPRSEVFGVNVRGKQDQVFARDVDVEASPIVVGGPDDAPVFVAARIGGVDLPPRFAAALKECLSSDPSAVRRVVESA
ncbi:MAG TPA: hypothetical protein VIK33_18485 [Anaerolineae bacterium]